MPGIPGLPLFLQCTLHRLAKAAHSGHLSPPVPGGGTPLGKAPPAFRSAGQQGGLGWCSGLGGQLPAQTGPTVSWGAKGLVSPEAKATFGF